MVITGRSTYHPKEVRQVGKSPRHGLDVHVAHYCEDPQHPSHTAEVERHLHPMPYSHPADKGGGGGGMEE